ncbi:3409_t:CDS:1, partial [Acaulospora colombiana]
MSEDQNWILKSGKCVEDTIFRHSRILPTETYLHSWIIDIRDEDTESLFTVEEWDEIKNEDLKFPEVDEAFTESMMRFAN